MVMRPTKTQGVIPGRSEDLSRERDKYRRAAPSNGMMMPTTPMKPDENWHPTARMIWDAAHESGQMEWYQQTDWAILYSLMEDLSSAKNQTEKQGRVPAVLMSTLYAAMAALGLTEGDRRRMHIELQKDNGPQQDPALAHILEYKQRLGAMA